LKGLPPCKTPHSKKINCGLRLNITANMPHLSYPQKWITLITYLYEPHKISNDKRFRAFTNYLVSCSYRKYTK